MTTTYPPVPANSMKPVRSFLGVVGAVYVLLPIIWWSGIGAVRAEVAVASTRDNPGTPERSATLTLSNKAPTAVTVRKIEVIDRRFANISSTTPRIEGNKSGQVRITYEVDCGQSRPFPNAPVLVAHVRTVAGFDRRVLLESAISLGC